MNKSTELTLLVNGNIKGHLICPIIDNIKTIQYSYDTYRKLTKVNLICDSEIHNLDKLVESVIAKVPKDAEEIQINVSCNEIVSAWH